MKTLYAVTIKGTMLYFEGDLTNQECIAVETLANQFTVDNQCVLDPETIFQLFINEVEAVLRITLVQISIKYIFRIRE